MCTLFANLYVLLTRGPHMVYMGTPYIFYIYMITCGWLGSNLSRIQVWCNHWWMIQNPRKTKPLVVSRSRTDNPLRGKLVLSAVSIRDSLNLDILGGKFDSKLTFEDHVLGIVTSVSQRNGILRLVKHVFVRTCKKIPMICIVYSTVQNK